MLILDTATVLKKTLGLIYFILGGILVFLAFNLPQSLLENTGLLYVIPMMCFLVAVSLMIEGYFKLTESDKLKW